VPWITSADAGAGEAWKRQAMTATATIAMKG
jgi:hypothetical protein